MSKTNQKGDVGELAVASKLSQLGYKVAIPFGHDWKYDLIVEVDGELKRVQIKTCKPKRGMLRIYTRSMSNITKGKQVRTTYTKDDFDYLIVYDYENHNFYNIPMDVVHETKDSIWLRVIPTSNKLKTIRRAEDYLLTKL